MKSPIDRQAHWQRVHQAKPPQELSWFQSSPSLSLDLVEQFCPNVDERIIDVGGGIASLADGLIDRGYRAVSVLDVSEASLEHSRSRLARAAHQVDWIVGDVLTVELTPGFALWHDRAVFHFLTDPADREVYATRMFDALKLHGHAIIATFAHDGPTRCSGLEVVRYSSHALHEQLGADRFEMVHEQRDVHVTPTGKQQRFQFAVFRRRC